MTSTSLQKMPFWKDSLLLAAELAARNVYWRIPRLRAWVKHRNIRQRLVARTADREGLKDYLRSLGVTEGALVMAHTSITGLTLTQSGASPESSPNPLKTASVLVDDLMGLLGTFGTLVMPTNPIYQNDADFCVDNDAKPPLKYNPAKTPCGVGLANELFWRRRGVQRSLHPFNSLAACGPLAGELLQNNLNEFKPLPHGVHSGYYRFCQRNGLVISIGTPLASCLTLVHAPEEAMDTQYPIKDFYQERRYIVCVNGVEEPWIIREVRAEYSMFCRCGRKLWRDLRSEGIVHEGSYNGVPVGWARSLEVFDYIADRCKKRSYPYYCTWLVGRKR
jgi:aminoglycoside N3'-acetyltransferase